jgi:uncharacterized membrane protein
MERMRALASEALQFHGAQTLQNIHPLVVHFPIAFLSVSALFYLFAWILRRESLATTGLWLLGLGALGSIAAVYTGLRASEGVMVAPSVRQHILVFHERLMLIVLGFSLVLALWAIVAPPMPRRGRVVFVLGMLVMTALLARGADFGGWMVYGYNAGGSLPQPIEFSQ